MNPAIELFRGIAAWMVLTSHYAASFVKDRSVLNFFATGVNLFFVISGLVFARMIYAGKVEILPYAVRRFFRIYPLYFCSLIFYYIFSDAAPERWFYFIRHLFFLHTTDSVKEAVFFNPAYWSLPIEIEFYLCVPILAFLSSRYKYSISLLFIVFMIIRLIIVLNSLNISNPGFIELSAVHLPGMMTEFIAGILLFRIHTTYQNANIRPLYQIFIFVMGFAILYALSRFFVLYGDQGINDNLFFKSFFTMLCAIGYAVVLFPFLVNITEKKSVFISFCAVMGNMSYGMYLFHNLIIRFFKNSSMSGITLYAVCLTSVILVSLLFHYLIEKPCRIYGRHLSTRIISGHLP